MTAEVNVPDEAWEAADKAAAGVYTRSDILARGLTAAAPLIVADELEKVVGERGDLPYDVWGSQIADRAVVRLAELRGESR